MSITRHLAELILAEHKFRPIRGEVLLLGRQLVVMTPDEAQALVEKVGLPQATGARIDYDKTPHPFEKRLISDASFFSLFSDANVRASDVSDYEGAEIIFNLSEAVPDPLLGKFDFIYNGSVLDNVFDPAACIRNISKMLKPDAVAFHYEGAAHSSPAYLKFSPDWLFDYHALNGFADFQGYIVTYGDVHRDPWSVYEWNAFTSEDDIAPLTMPMTLGPEAMVVAIAQNSPAATIDKTPLQNVYRSAEHAAYRAAHQRYARSARRQAIRALFPPNEPDPSPAPPRSRSPFDIVRSLRRNTAVPTAQISTAAAPGHERLGLVGSSKFLGE